MNLKFKIGDRVVCKGDGWFAYYSDGTSGKSPAAIYPKKGEIYTVLEIRDTGFLLLKEIPTIQNGIRLTWDQNDFEKLVEERVRYVVVEVDKKVKEKREELIFNN